MLKVIWFVPPAIQLVAAHRGFLVERQVAIEGTPTGSSDEQFEALRDGRQDAAITAMDNVIMWNRRPGGGDFRIVGQIEATTVISLVARAEFSAIAMLRGRRLLVDSADNGFVIALRALLADAGVDFGECQVLEAGGVKERFARLLAGEGDATLLGPPFAGLAEANGMRGLAQVDQVYPGFPGQGIVIRAGLPAERRDEIVRWLAALERARAECRSDAGAAAQALVAAGTDPAVASTLANAVSDRLTPDRPGVELLLAQRRQLGLPGAEDAYEDLVDPAPLASALALATS